MFTIEIKKRANSRKYTPVMQFMNEDEVVRYVKEKKLSFTSPYFFTHLELSDGSIIRQQIMGLTCSPLKLREKLEKI